MADTARRRAGGRPSKLTPERRKRLLDAIRAGAPKTHAAAAAGIDRETLRRWERRAEEPNAPAEYVAFAADLHACEAEAFVTLTATVRQAARTDWRAAAWLLERRAPDEYGRRDRVEHSGRIDSDTTVRVDALDPDVAAAARNLADTIAHRRRA